MMVRILSQTAIGEQYFGGLPRLTSCSAKTTPSPQDGGKEWLYNGLGLYDEYEIRRYQPPMKRPQVRDRACLESYYAAEGPDRH